MRAHEIDDHTAALRAHTDWRRYISRERDAMAHGWLRDRFGRYGRQATEPSRFAFAHMVEDTVSAETVWVSHEMMDLTQHAMEGFDRAEPLTIDDCFIPHGFMLLPEPFYSQDINGKRLATRAFLWRLVDPGVVVMTETDDEIGYTFDLRETGTGKTWPVLRVTTLSHIDDRDGYSDDDGMEELMQYMAEMRWWWGIIHTTAIPLPLASSLNEVRGEGDQQAAWLTFWRVAQKLMAERIITSERRTAGRAARREAQRLGYDFGAPRVIELRRPRGHEADPEGERLRDVNWTHRWIVRGHWRQQWYPSIKGHRQKWIGAYEKGPEDLPLVIRERVWNWDR